MMGNERTGKKSNSGNSNRLSNTTACLPIVYGSIAFYLGKKADEFQTHQWTLYVRGPNQEDLSVVISKVVFQLHASFAQPMRELTTPPFEVTERGWGEFEAQIRIIWKDPDEKPTVVNHGIKLYPPGAPPNVLPSNDNITEPVIAETYDEVVFTDPNEMFYRQLNRISVTNKVESSQQKYFTTIYSDQEDFLSLIEAQKFLQSELSSIKERYKIVNDELQTTEQTLIEAQQKHQLQQQQQQQQLQRESSSKKGKSSSSQRKSRPQSQSKKAKTSAAAAAAAAAASTTTVASTKVAATTSAAAGTTASSTTNAAAPSSSSAGSAPAPTSSSK